MSYIRIGKQLPFFNRNVWLQLGNNVKAAPVTTFEFTRILLQSISNDISDSINWKDKDSLNSKKERSLGISVKLTRNSCSLNNCTKHLVTSLYLLIIMIQKLIIVNLNTLL